MFRIKSDNNVTTGDKDNIYRENLKLKADLARMRQQITYNKAEISRVESELGKKERLIEEIALTTEQNYNSQNTSSIVNNNINISSTTPEKNYLKAKEVFFIY